MRAMVMDRVGAELRLETEFATPVPGPQEIRLRVAACGICRTDLHILDGELAPPRSPLVLGHEIVGRVEALGAEVSGLKVGDRVGVPWLGWTCGVCDLCRSGRENLCERARFTGFHSDGGYAERVVADARFAFLLPSGLTEVSAAPLLCAGMIGYRALRMAGPSRRVGFYGFGASAHITAQVALHLGQEVYAFTRPHDTSRQEFARSLGASWAGGSDELPPEPLDAAVVFAPSGSLVPLALMAVRKGGTVVCAGIHMSDLPGFPYRLLWGERVLRSVAHLTRKDGEEWLRLVPEAKIRTVTRTFPLGAANDALTSVRAGEIEGAAVLVP